MKYEIFYCYGGEYKGANRLTKIVEAANESEALTVFNALWKSEEIYSVKQLPDPELGAAQINIELTNSKITVRHTDKNGSILFERDAVKGDWDKIWEAIRNND